jgi:hypothetical protein
MACVTGYCFPNGPATSTTDAGFDEAGSDGASLTDAASDTSTTD